MKRLYIAISLIIPMLFIMSCGKEGDQVPVAGREEQTSAAVKAQPSALAAPAGVSTLSGDGQITISWNKVEGATSYNVYFSNLPSVAPATATRAGGITATSYVHTALKNNSMYYYIVTAENASGEGLPSGETGARPKATPPAAPTGVAAVSGGDRITVKWEPVQGAASYTVYFSERPELAKAQGNKVAGITSASYEHTELNKGVMYYYVVTASSGAGESQPSAESGAMLQTLPPATPTGVAAAGGEGKITVRWNAVAGATSYNVYYATGTGTAKAKGKRVSGIKTTSYRHDDVKKKAMYYYVVTAVNDEGESSASGETGAMP